MIRFGTRFLASRVAWRVVALFVVAALVPLALMVALSLSYVRDTLMDQGQQRLAGSAKAYGMDVIARMLDASDLVKHAVDAGVDPKDVFHATQPFRSLTLADPDGAFPQRLGPTLVVTLTEAQRKRLEAGQRVAHVEPQTEQAAAAVVVVVPVGRPDRRRWAYAELNPAYLWGDLAAWPTAMQFCVAEWSSLAPIFCAGAVPEAAMRADRGQPARSAREPIAWEADGARQRSATWGLFLNVEFGTGDWIVVATLPEAELLRPAVAFKGVFLPVAALALLVVVWLSLRLIRSTLTPLEQLTRATRRVVAHDFGSRVEITRDDEFGELASAFNAMTRRLGKQFTALNAMAEIDREILSSRDLERVVLTALRHLHHLVPAQAIGVVLLDQDNGSLARTSFAACRRPEDVTTVRIPLGADDATLLRQSPAGTWFPATEPCPECIRVVLSSSAQAAFAYPIEWREALCGSLVFAVDAPTSLTEDELAQVREAAARMAVAVSSAWRDAQLYRQAHFDALTGLPNRPLFLDRLSQEIAHCQRDDTRFSLLFIDLDHFKKINDTQGHSRGDAVLVETAQRLLRCVRSSDTVARLGGDEFTISIRQAANQAEVGRVVQQVLSSLAEPFDIDGQQSYLGASIGIAAFPLDGATAEELLKNADTAMYRAKASGRGQAVYYQETMNREAREVVALERELHVAVERQQFELHYQPQIGLRSGNIVGAEALIRWRHPERGLVSPAKFIPVAEESELIERIGRWALREACEQLRTSRARGIVLPRVSVNVSIRQLYQPGFVETVHQTLERFGCDPGSLELEVTESMLAERVTEVQATLDQLSALGVALALDDFGTGYASLAYLRDLPIQVVKIDQSFVRGLPFNEGSVTIVRAMIAMSHALGKTVTAEGVETEAQLNMLRALDCDTAQGYLISRPVPAAEFESFMRKANHAERNFAMAAAAGA